MNQAPIPNVYFSGEGFAQINHHLQLLLTPDEHYLLHVLIRYMNLNNNNCELSIKAIAKQCGWKNAKIYNVINRLIDKHVIETNRIFTANGLSYDYTIYQFGNIETCKQVIEMLNNDEDLKKINQHTYGLIVQYVANNEQPRPDSDTVTFNKEVN